MMGVWTVLLGIGGIAFGGADPDAYRKVSEGHRVYTGTGVEVGKVYQGFVIRFAGSDDTFLSPSRYRVAYESNALQCRNTEAFPLDPERAGRWWEVAFEVLAVRETAVEEPAGSGNWTWKPAYDCEIKALKPVD